MSASIIQQRRKFIGFCGAGGVGKTSTAIALCQMRSWRMLPSASRSVFKAMGIAREDEQKDMTQTQRWELQQAIQLAHYRQQRDLAEDISVVGPVVCDRTQWDQFAYAMLQCAEHINQVDFDWIGRLCTDTLDYYTHIFYFPFHTYPQLGDGMRTENWVMRRKHDLLLTALMNMYDIQGLNKPQFVVVPRIVAADEQFESPRFMTPMERAAWISEKI